MKRYNPSEIEPKWQKIWADDQRYKAPDVSDKPKYYVTGMFPYPSGAGMHTGHFFEHSIVDGEARFRRALGYNVMYPMGFDNFGLPAENYAIKTGVSPQKATADNIVSFKNQLTRVGASIDWDREVRTSDPSYYKWTQWIFAELFERGLAYQKEANQWWCPKDKTVLANEQVVNGRCWRCEELVVKKPMKQWFFKITDYADALLEEIPALNWPDKIKVAQENWIGRSEGAEINFAVADDPSKTNFVVIHGFTGSPDKNMLPWLKAELEAKGYGIQVPELPNTDNPVEEEQVGYVLKNCTFDENTVLVGHSLGGAVAMKVLEKLPHAIRKLVLIAPVVEPAFRGENYVNENPKKPRTFVGTFDFSYSYETIIAKAPRRLILSDSGEASKRRPYLEYLSKQIDAPLLETEGKRVHFTADEEPFVLENLFDDITVFSTRPDTLFGATFLVLAPEHPLARELATDATREMVNAYIDEAIKKSEIERQAEGKDKTGVFTGSYAINPASGEKVPIWIADYVLGGYGTGAIMAVPAHDERDLEFAEKFKLPVKAVIEPEFGKTNEDETEKNAIIAIVRNPKTGQVLVLDWGPRLENSGGTMFIGGGMNEGEDPIETARREIVEETGFINVRHIQNGETWIHNHFYSNVKNKHVVAHFLPILFELVDEEQVDQDLDENENQFHFKWVDENTLADIVTEPAHLHGYEAIVRPGVYKGEGRLINSGQFDGKSSSDVREEIVAWLEQQGTGRTKTTYKMRDWLISRQRYWGAPIPIIHCDEHGAVAVPKEDLPVLLPEVEDYAPKGDGKSPLARQTDWVATTCPTCGGPARRETDVMDGYACSSWYLLRYTDPANDKEAWSPEKATYWTPLDMYVGGDHAVAHLLYVRFWNHVFYDMGLVPTKEPVKQLVYHGLIQAEDGTKMSKSKGNVVDPLDIIDQGYGADALRTFELFLGPINENSNWSSTGIAGVYRFLNRLWTLVQEYDVSDKATSVDVKKLDSTIHTAIKKVTDDLRRLSFNTAIAAQMECVNELYKLKIDGFSPDWQSALESLVQLVQPFAPHMAAELWQQLGHDSQLDFEPWPQWSEDKIVQDIMTIAVQVNGKLRAQIAVGRDASEEDITAEALANENVVKFVGDKKPAKVIYVPGRLVSIVV